MKKILCYFLLMLFFCGTAFAQTNTNLGTGAGNAGGGNTCIGNNAGDDVTGNDNTFVGRESGPNATSGNYNAFFGAFSGNAVTTASSNTFLGYASGNLTTTGANNTFVGRAAGFYNSTGGDNTYLGHYAGFASTTPSGSVAIGRSSLQSNTTGTWNTSIGAYSIYSNTTGVGNSSLGYYTLYTNTTGSGNAAVGYRALESNTTGGYNVALGNYALSSNTTGNHNIGIGHQSGNTTGSRNVIIGYYSNSGDYNDAVAIGSFSTNTASNQIRLGDAYIASIGGYQDWTNISDGRFKDNIREDVAGLDFIKQLRPVSYNLNAEALDAFLGVKREENKQSRLQPDRRTGFIAQEVEQTVNSGGFIFTGVDAAKGEKDTYGIQYGQFVVPLVKAVQELSEKVDQQQILIADLISQLQEARVNSATQASSSGNKFETHAVLYQNAPNPFSSETSISMELPESSREATVYIYDMGGKELKAVPVTNRGSTSILISSREFAAGIYIYALLIDGKLIDTKRMILTR